MAQCGPLYQRDSGWTHVRPQLSHCLKWSLAALEGRLGPRVTRPSLVAASRALTPRRLGVWPPLRPPIPEHQPPQDLDDRRHSSSVGPTRNHTRIKRLGPVDLEPSFGSRPVQRTPEVPPLPTGQGQRSVVRGPSWPFYRKDSPLLFVMRRRQASILSMGCAARALARLQGQGQTDG